MTDAEPIFTIKCEGGCGRTMQTNRLTVLWTATYCSECQPEGAQS